MDYISLFLISFCVFAVNAFLTYSSNMAQKIKIEKLGQTVEKLSVQTSDLLLQNEKLLLILKTVTLKLREKKEISSDFENLLLKIQKEADGIDNNNLV